MPARVQLSLVVAIMLVGIESSQVGWALVQTPSLKTTNSFKPSVDCKEIKFADPSRLTKVREEVLRAMCLRAAPHVDLDDKLKQFAVFLLHRDHFDSLAKWHSGDAKDVLADQYWVVNEVKALEATKYHWYTHGLPIWPLPYQALSNSTSSKKLPTLKKKKKPVDWPNYGLATPIYYASNAWRNQVWSLEEFFQQEKKKSPFKSHKDFHKLAKELVAGIDGQSVESYSEWPFLKYSLIPMVKSMVQRNKGLCPDELYIFTRLSPCYPGEEAHLTCAQAALQARTLLTHAACRTTDVIVGYTQNYNNDAL